MDDQDEFRSEPEHSGRLSYTLPDWNTLTELSGLPTDWFSSFHEVWFVLSLRNNIGEEILCCTDAASCRIRPNWYYTPLYKGMSPNVMYYDQVTTMIVNPKLVPE
jgi:hypothetical protein